MSNLISRNQALKSYSEKKLPYLDSIFQLIFSFNYEIYII